jgi:hypothetical protein
MTPFMHKSYGVGSMQTWAVVEQLNPLSQFERLWLVANALPLPLHCCPAWHRTAQEPPQSMPASSPSRRPLKQLTHVPLPPNAMVEWQDVDSLELMAKSAVMFLSFNMEFLDF